MKKFSDILSDMASWVVLSGSKVTNFLVGSVARSFLEAVAMEIEELYYFIQSQFTSLQDNSIYTSFGFTRRPAVPATGTVTVNFTQTLTQSYLFPAGTRFFTQPINGVTVYFDSTQDVTANIGVNTVDIPVQCETPGVTGNVPAFSITRIVNSAPLLQNLYNSNRFFNGMPEETKEEQQTRFGNFLASIARGSNAAIVYGCMQIPTLAGIYIQEGIGMIYVYAHDSYGNLPDTLKTSIQNTLYNYKAGGIMAIISGVTKKPVDLSIEVLVNTGSDVNSTLFKVQDGVTVYLSQMTVSKSLILADLIHAIMDIDRVAIANISLNINADIIVQPQELIQPGTITVTQMEG